MGILYARPTVSRLLALAVLTLIISTTACQPNRPLTWPDLGTELPSGDSPNQHSDVLRGINIATLLTQADTIYDHPEVANTGEPQSSYDALAAGGHELIRLPVDWDFLQPRLDAGDSSFDAAYWTAVQAEVAKIGAAGLRVVFDLHNGCEWTRPRSTEDALVCGDGLSTEKTTQVWRQLSDAFRDDPTVIAYDLFNEPIKFNHPFREELFDPEKQPYSAYQEHVNAVIDTIRRNGDGKEIWVQPLCCNIFLDFANTDPNGGWVVDPLDRVVYSQHMYPVPDSDEGEEFNPAKLAPDYQEPPNEPWADLGYTSGFLGRLADFGRWCADSGVRCSIGEVGWYGPGQSAESIREWNALGDQWYTLANELAMPVAYWAASSAYTGNSWAYDAGQPDQWHPAPGLNRRLPPAEIIEKPEHQSR